MDKYWIHEETELRSESRNASDAVFTLGNGYMGSRGFFEEEQELEGTVGGIYLAGVYGQGKLTAWNGLHRELANTPNCYHVKISIDGELVLPRPEQVSEYVRRLDMKNGILERSFVWTGKNGQNVRFRFERFVSMSEKHVTGQRVEMTPLNGNPKITITSGIIGSVTNLFSDTLLIEPTRPGLRHLKTIGQHGQIIETQVDRIADGTTIAQGQTCSVVVNGRALTAANLSKPDFVGCQFKCSSKAGQSLVMTKLVYTATSRDGKASPVEHVQSLMDSNLNYDVLLAEHKNVWKEKWHRSDVEISGNADDQRALRFNIFHLIQVCPEHDPRLSIGARGLTGEMHEGGVFWDTEIFKLPFFTFTNPEAASKLLQFRFNTLPEARRHAQELWFNGAMFAWKSGIDGAEETEKNVGAFYAIHIISDIAYTIQQYWEASGDDAFMHQYGTEILIETARFWQSRSYYNPIRKNYNILAVRGPNEYDVIVNNNVYTNMMAVENLRYAGSAIERLKKTEAQAWTKLAKKLKFSENECADWQKVIDGMQICYDKKTDLYAEDDMYMHRVPFDMKRGKTSLKRVIDSTLPYEAMSLYQITKQSDVVCLMNLLPWKFTKKQRQLAYDFYEPKTVHDSSLSYSPHGVISARLGMLSEAYRYFKASAYLDIMDGQLNTQSGLHFANFGGTWQIAVMGFAGLNMDNGVLKLNANLPKQWKSMRFRLHYKDSLLRVSIQADQVTVEIEQQGQQELKIYVGNKRLKKLRPTNPIL